MLEVDWAEAAVKDLEKLDKPIKRAYIRKAKRKSRVKKKAMTPGIRLLIG